MKNNNCECAVCKKVFARINAVSAHLVRDVIGELIRQDHTDWSEAKGRIRSRRDHQVNLKAEPEIRQIHEKPGHLLSKQWERLAQIQEIRIEQLSEINELKQRPRAGE